MNTYRSHFEAWQASSRIRTLKQARQWLDDTEDLKNLICADDGDWKLFKAARWAVSARAAATEAKRAAQPITRRAAA